MKMKKIKIDQGGQAGTGICKRMKTKRDEGREENDNAEAQRARSCGRGTPLRVFFEKSVDLLDCKGVEFFGDDKESVTV
jgi:hypothetical protein